MHDLRHTMLLPAIGTARHCSASNVQTARSLQEVVSLGVRGSLNSAKLQQSAAPHASPRHFHEMLAKAEEDSDMGTLLLDVRNHYETRIGSFQAVRLCRFIP